jgi:hypothetical protein
LIAAFVQFSGLYHLFNLPQSYSVIGESSPKGSRQLQQLLR